MYPSTDAPLRDMPLVTKSDAVKFVKAYAEWLYANGATGNGAFLAKRWKPATIRAPDIVAKAHTAYELAEMNYWQMSYERAKQAHHGLPFSKWRDERQKRGLPVEL